MSKTKKRQAFAERFEFSDEEFEASGIRELSFEELLAVNGGRHVIDDPSTDDVSDTIANGGHSPGGSSSSSDSGSSGGSSGGSSSAPPSSSPSEPVIGSDSDDTGGSTCDGWNNYWNGLTSGGSSGGGSSGSTGDSSGNSDLSGDSSSNDSSGDDYSSGDDSDSGYWGSGGSGYTPPAQSQPAPKPNKGEETSPTQGGGAPRGDLSPLKGIAPEYRPLWPTESKRITSKFGPDHNTGIDIGAVNRGVKGDAIVASMGGTVTTSGVPEWSKSQSPYVIIKGDDKKEYRYVHLNISPGIFEGRRVNQGELIGSMSDNGAEGQVHLHFEIRDAGKPLSPIDLLP